MRMSLLQPTVASDNQTSLNWQSGSLSISFSCRKRDNRRACPIRDRRENLFLARLTEAELKRQLESDFGELPVGSDVKPSPQLLQIVSNICRNKKQPISVSALSRRSFKCDTATFASGLSDRSSENKSVPNDHPSSPPGTPKN